MKSRKPNKKASAAKTNSAKAKTAKANAKKGVAKAKTARGAKHSVAKRSVAEQSGQRQGAPVFVLTQNAALARSVTSVAKGAAVVRNFAGAVGSVATGARLGLVDATLTGENAYECIRKLRVRSPIRIALIHPNAQKLDAAVVALARFAGAETILSSPPKANDLRELVKPQRTAALDDAILAAKEQDAARTGTYQDRVLRDISNPSDPAVIDALCDPETRLYSSAYATHAYDLEFKRGQRFALPLSIAIVGFEGEASREVLLDLAAIFLNEIRDTDMLARFDVNTFFFVMPNTLAEGARVMLERIARSVTERRLLDLVGDPIELASGVACLVMPSKETREGLFARAQHACEKARAESIPAVVA
jgi:GGDEF domain-containing protein